jgi:hypothetical protein
MLARDPFRIAAAAGALAILALLILFVAVS